MSIFPEWNYHHLRGLEMLEAQEDWLTQIINSLGYYLHHHCSCRQPDCTLDECLGLLERGLQQTLHQEEIAFAELGHHLDTLHQSAHQQLQQVIETLRRRHAHGEAIGEHLLNQLQDWLLEHCGQLHTEVLRH